MIEVKNKRTWRHRRRSVKVCWDSLKPLRYQGKWLKK